jgi:4-amino-4-deoxy-L-arabinose transferase-like glycosyltransferase
MTAPAPPPEKSVHIAQHQATVFAFRGLFFAVVAGLFMLFYATKQFRGFNQPEAMDQAQLARNIARGQGYTTQWLRPLSLWRLHHLPRWRDMRLQDHPDLVNPPVYPALLATLFYVVQKGDMKPPSATASTSGKQTGAKRSWLARIIGIGYWKYLWAGLGILWFIVATLRGIFLRLHPQEAPWHVAGIVTCAALFGLFWTPKTSFEVGPDAIYSAFGPERWIIYGLGLPLAVGNGLLIYLMGRRLFAPRVGLTAACAFAFSETTCQHAISGLNVLLLTLWAGLAWLALLVAAEREEQGGKRLVPVLLALAAAALVALAFLTKYAAGWLLLPACLLAWRTFGLLRGLWVALGMAGIFVTVTLPWLLRNYWISGNLLGLANYSLFEGTQLFPGDKLERMLEPGALAVPFKLIWWKFLRNAYELWSDSAWFVGFGVAAAVFAGVIFYKFRRPLVNRFKWLTIGGTALLYIVTSVFGAEPRPQTSVAQAGNLPVLMAPMMIIFATALFYVFMDAFRIILKTWRISVVTAFLLASALPALLRLAMPPAGRLSYPPYHPPKLAMIAGYFDPAELLAADQPWGIAWYGDRRCLSIPFTMTEFYKLNDMQEHVSGLLLTPSTLNSRLLSDILAGEWAPWGPAVGFLKFPDNFPLKVGQILVGPRMEPIGWDMLRSVDLSGLMSGVHMVLVCDRDRWTRKAARPK